MADDQVAGGGRRDAREDRGLLLWLGVAALAGLLASVLQASSGPEFLVGAHALTSTKVTVNGSMGLITGSQIGFSIVFFLTGLRAIDRMRGETGLARPVAWTSGFLVALGLVGVAATQHLAVTVVQDQSSFDLGPRGVRSIVLLLSQARSVTTWAAGALLVVWLGVVATQGRRARWPVPSIAGSVLVGVVVVVALLTAGELTRIPLGG